MGWKKKSPKNLTIRLEKWLLTSLETLATLLVPLWPQRTSAIFQDSRLSWHIVGSHRPRAIWPKHASHSPSWLWDPCRGGGTTLDWICVIEPRRKPPLYKGSQPLDVLVFPIGLIHFQFIPLHTPAVTFAGLSSQNAGVITIDNSMFGSTPPINPDVLTRAFQVDKDVINHLQKQFWYDNN